MQGQSKVKTGVIFQTYSNDHGSYAKILLSCKGFQKLQFNLPTTFRVRGISIDAFTQVSKIKKNLMNLPRHGRNCVQGQSKVNSGVIFQTYQYSNDHGNYAKILLLCKGIQKVIIILTYLPIVPQYNSLCQGGVQRRKPWGRSCC